MKGKGDGLCKKRVPQCLIHGKGSVHGSYDDEEHNEEKDDEHLSTHPDSFHLPHHFAAGTYSHTRYTHAQR